VSRAAGRGDKSGLRTGDVVYVDPVTRGDDGLMRFALDTEPELEGALVAIDPATGEVKAMVGGVDFRRSQFNRAAQARRQPGSAFKPFIYSAAIDRGYTATTIVTDAQVPLRKALTNSLNTVSVRLALDIGIDPLRDYLRIFGFPADFPRNFSLALGSSEVTLLDLTRAYSVFATLGRRFEPVFVTSVTDTAGRAVDFPGSNPRFEPVLNPAMAYVMTDMMRSVVESGT